MTQRLLDGDPDELRGRYLFRLAHICHISSIDVDALRFLDFIRYIIDIDGYEKAENERWKQLGG